ncbi:hypothetical protein ACQ3I4_06810 [Zafaria sp. Z1313]|uniref:hypothetical protein n=1 Tax=Zafaria sp. Z1313 TaxID=3423202 RepID=UPI003D30337B
MDQDPAVGPTHAQGASALPSEDDGGAAPGAPADAAVGVGEPDEDAGLLGRFPEAVEATRAEDEAPSSVGASGVAFRVLLYAGMAVGTIAALGLVAAALLQGIVAGTSMQAGIDYLGSGIDGALARELLAVPLGGFIVAVVVSLAAICAGAYGVFRQRRRRG